MWCMHLVRVEHQRGRRSLHQQILQVLMLLELARHCLLHHCLLDCQVASVHDQCPHTGFHTACSTYHRPSQHALDTRSDAPPQLLHVEAPCDECARAPLDKTRRTCCPTSMQNRNTSDQHCASATNMRHAPETGSRLWTTACRLPQSADGSGC